MLLDENSCRQRLHGVGIEDRYGRLRDDWTTIELGCHQMHRDAADADAVRERLPLRLQAGKSRQKRRVNVENGVRERIEQRPANQAHESGQADEPDLTGLE